MTCLMKPTVTIVIKLKNNVAPKEPIYHFASTHYLPENYFKKVKRK